MLEKYVNELQEKKNLRENLSSLRGEAKEPEKKTRLLAIFGDGAVLTALLEEEDPKVRKNAALLLGDLMIEAAVMPLLDAYKKEKTLFVRSSYLAALSRLDVREHLTFFKEQLQALAELEPAENERKHITEEIRELEKIITQLEGRKKHVFTGFQQVHEILLATNRELVNVTQAEVMELSADVRRRVAAHPLGVLVQAMDLRPFLRLRTYRELLIPIHAKGKLAPEPKAAALGIWNSDMPAFLQECHREETPFYFRLEIKSRMELDKKTAFAKRFSAELERLSGRAFINSTRDYEVEIRLVETRDGSFQPFVKLFTVPMKRFSYRKNAIATSIHPALAASLMELARPYLKEDAQILDPFCGVGTMLIERDIRVSAREKYGIDIFGEAIAYARENAAAAGEKINFINRDYFDFKHGYLFDEIITNMPVRGKRTKEEMDAFYGAFFERSRQILAPGGVMILYTGEEGFVKKQLRLQTDYRLMKEVCVREKDHTYLYIIGYQKR